MNNSIKQVLRTPWKTALFLSLITLSVALFVVGLTLFRNASMNLEKADDSFVTIGTVQQKENTMLTEARWDAGLKNYVYSNTPVYDSYIPIITLRLHGVEYISGPEHRPFYGGYVPDLVVRENDLPSLGAVIEFIPVEECVPSEPVEVEVVNVLYGYDLWGKDLQGQRIKFCDHFTEQPKSMQSGKTYIAFVVIHSTNTDQHQNLDKKQYEREYAPHKIYAGQIDAWEEVNEGFYETTDGERWLSFVKAVKRFYESTVPVTPTQDTQLLSAFHGGVAAIVEGRTISQEEHDSGAKVCLISQRFAAINHIGLGSTVKLKLYDANYNSTGVNIFGYSGVVYGKLAFLNSDGEPYEVFQESNYTVVGVYSHPYVSGMVSGYELSPNEVIVPMNSITNSDADNIVATGPMQGKNTSFRIANGASGKFMEALCKITESSLLEVQFYDNGYEQFAAGLKNVSLIGLVLFCVGLVTSLAVISLVLYFYIIKQRKRTAIERTLGMNRRKCVASLMLGILLLTAAGAGAGCVMGNSISSIVQDKVLSEDGYFNTKYSRGLVNVNGADNELDMALEEGSDLIPSLLTVTGAILLVFILSWILINRNLSIAPIHLLSSKGNE